ncbi:MAG: amidohydrolase/deacetylase family metallohydrolase [Candidatus Latescibacteria bacterium]|nr:amidohydrolase/deacetylase family metallohydrolase [Candidatus Latescibacterota bacterium]
MTDTPTLDLVLKGGRLLDPANDLDGHYDIGIKDGRIARVEADIPAIQAAQQVDVSGLLITPGLLDIHIHAYWTRNPDAGIRVFSLNPDAHFLKEGVTTCVDTGTAGADEFDHFCRSVIDTATCRVLAYVNIAAPGMGPPEQVVANLIPHQAAETALAHRDVVVGIKTAHYWTKYPFDEDHPPWASVDRTVQAGDICDMPVMIDFWPRPPQRSYPDLILKHLRPGDIHTHVFAQQFPIVDEQGQVYDHMHQARERGIHFDLGHGAASFWYRNAAPAIKNGFPPDSISTDLHMGNINGHVHSMLDTMAKCLAMGMPLEEVIYRSTVTPAQAIRRPELGTLSVGAEADVAVLKIEEGAFSYRDCGWARIDGQQRLECALTLRAGRVVWDRHGLTSPHWEEAPESYFLPPHLQTGPIQRLWR